MKLLLPLTLCALIITVSLGVSIVCAWLAIDAGKAAVMSWNEFWF